VFARAVTELLPAIIMTLALCIRPAIAQQSSSVSTKSKTTLPAKIVQAHAKKTTLRKSVSTRLSHKKRLTIKQLASTTVSPRPTKTLRYDGPYSYQGSGNAAKDFVEGKRDSLTGDFDPSPRSKRMK
jgi:hypothetical protein